MSHGHSAYVAGCEDCRRYAREAKRATWRRHRDEGGLAEGDPRHGTPNGYTNHGCRCAPCKTAWAAEFKRMAENRAARLAADPTLAPHGVVSTYFNWKCRCVECRSAHAAATRELRARKRSA